MPDCTESMGSRTNLVSIVIFFFFQAEDGIRDYKVTGDQTCALPISASDGSRSPTEVVRAAKAAGLLAIALTDHDSVTGLAEAQTAGSQLGVRIVNEIGRASCRERV